MKTILGWLAVAFAVWWIVTDPPGAATAVKGLAHLADRMAVGLSDAISSL